MGLMFLELRMSFLISQRKMSAEIPQNDIAELDKRDVKLIRNIPVLLNT